MELKLRHGILIAIACILMQAFAISGQEPAPKREFRGAWLHTVFQSQYRNQTTAGNKAYICEQLDKLKAAGINAVIFQVRPQYDAFYASRLEPWSIFLTDNGQAPKPFWDPLEFIIEQAHNRGMELHAWLNPYRVTSSAKQTLPKSHMYYRHPEYYVTYDGKIFADPGEPANRQHIIDVVSDIVERYDVDGIHFDDYFYPYPAGGKEFGDDRTYKLYGGDMDRGDWRRSNVDSLICELNAAIKALKPWVRFGISPFGIWRNRKNDPRGSETDGLQNYDSLYADVILWLQNGWIDYLMPQLYWSYDHPKAPYGVLAEWWDTMSAGRHIYIGQSVGVTIQAPETGENQLADKMQSTRQAQAINGHCWWPGYDVAANKGGIADALKDEHNVTIAIPPAYPWLHSSMPEGVSDVKISGNKLTWNATTPTGKIDDAVRFVVYRFDSDEAMDLDSATNIVDVTPARSINISRPGYYVVTALDRTNNESFPSEAVLKK